MIFAALAMGSAGCALLPVDLGSAAAGWKEAPTQPDPEMADAAQRFCLDAHGFAPAAAIEIQDQRGPDGAAFLWRDGKHEAECFVYRTADGVLQATGWGEWSWGGRPLDFLADTSSPIPGGPSWASGPTGPGAVTVDIALPDGTTVSASVADGYYIAWWPGSADWVSIVARDADGNQTGEVGLAAAPTSTGQSPSPSMSAAGQTPGWTAIPIAPDPEARAIADRDCVAFTPPGGTLILQDQRGTDGALFIYGYDQLGLDYACFVGRDPDGVLRWSSQTTGIPPFPDDLHPVEMLVLPVDMNLDLDAAVVWTVAGRVPAGTVSVGIELTDGTHLEASVVDGRYAAWWPNEANIATVTALGPDGAILSAARGQMGG
ncbi:MAG: hypothetical protein U0869_15755 [Chloroflexota bacterium]